MVPAVVYNMVAIFALSKKSIYPGEVIAICHVTGID